MTVKCPNCGIELTLPNGLEEGQKIQCTMCQVKFFLGTNRKESSDSINSKCSCKICVSKLKDFWQQKTWCRNIAKVIGAVCILKIVIYLAGTSGTIAGTRAVEADKAALTEMLRVADQQGDWIAYATNHFENTSQDYRNFVFDLINSVDALSTEFLKVRKIYEELDTAGKDFVAFQSEEWRKRMNDSAATCRVKSKHIILHTKLKRASFYYKTRRQFLIGMYFLIFKHLEKYEAMAAVVSDAGKCARRCAARQSNPRQDEKSVQDEFRKILDRTEKIEQEIQNINSTKIKPDELEKFMMDYE